MTPIDPITARLYVRLMAEEALKDEIEQGAMMRTCWADQNTFEDYTITIAVRRKQDEAKNSPSQLN